MAAPRLRRAFKYPEEDVDGDSEGRDEMDEEGMSYGLGFHSGAENSIVSFGFALLASCLFVDSL